MEEREVREQLEKSFAERPMNRPAFCHDERFGNPAQPVVGVSWFEARAYCRWLSDHWRLAGTHCEFPLPEGYAVRLPTEAEWEKASRVSNGGRYPWGNRWDSDRANTSEGHVLRTTPVGIYPDGSTAAGLHDICGNVWEWTLSLYRDYPYDPGDARDAPEAKGPRVLRGGSWNVAQSRARCTFRNKLLPGDYNFARGFRAVVSPSIPSL